MRWFVLPSVRASEPNLMSSPFFPVDVLKQLMMENLTEAVLKGAAHIRDPIGGSNETLFVYVGRYYDYYFSPLPLAEVMSDRQLKMSETHLVSQKHFWWNASSKIKWKMFFFLPSDWNWSNQRIGNFARYW